MSKRAAGRKKSSPESEQLQAIKTGSRVELELVSTSGQKERLTLDLVREGQADFEAGRLSEQSALARAIVGQVAGARVPYHVGDLVQVVILTVSDSPDELGPGDKPSAEEVMRRALDQAELNNMINFALTFDSKWGDYDPEQIAANWARDANSEEKKKDDEEA